MESQRQRITSLLSSPTHTHLSRAAMLTLTLLMMSIAGTSQSATVQSKITLNNESTYELAVENLEISGDPLSKKAWKKGAPVILPGSSETILTVNRSGKVNWMDPTPRFIEPGKTVIFSITIGVSNLPVEQLLRIKQKLFGEGKTSKMWHTVEPVSQPAEWVLEGTDIESLWRLDDSTELKVTTESIEENGSTHLLYRVTNEDSQD